MYLSKENFTCLIVQISLYLSVLKQLITLSKKQYETIADINCLVNSVDPDQLPSSENLKAR